MGGGQLQRVDHAQHLIEVASDGHRVDQHQCDGLVGGNHKDVAQRRILRGSSVSGVPGGVGGQHPVGLGHREIGVGDHRIIGRDALGIGDVL